MEGQQPSDHPPATPAVVQGRQTLPPTSSSSAASHTSPTPKTDAPTPAVLSSTIPRTPTAPVKHLLAGLNPSSPTPRSIQRSVTAPPSPTKPLRPIPPAKSGTDPPGLEQVAKLRSASLNAAGARRGSSRSRVTSTEQRETERPVAQKRERAYLEKLKLYETKTVRRFSSLLSFSPIPDPLLFARNSTLSAATTTKCAFKCSRLTASLLLVLLPVKSALRKSRITKH
jgi:hypothetical protein